MSGRNPRVFTDLRDNGALIRHDWRKLTSLLTHMAREMLVG
ncbi:unannotated protein [freshwater metagenome]|uniref:Unannotated protein n=1 Tax=freshwater metagenome TaxID=449393 RepID=A0A6J6MQ60_9ZZZZ